MVDMRLMMPAGEGAAEPKCSLKEVKPGPWSKTIQEYTCFSDFFY